MNAKWSGICAKCDTTYQRGDPIKPQYKRDGMNPDTGKPVWVRVPKQYVHEKCPRVTPNRPGQKPPPSVDPLTGEILVAQSSEPSLVQETLW